MNPKKLTIALGMMVLMLAVLDTQSAQPASGKKIKIYPTSRGSYSLIDSQKNNLEVWLNGLNGEELFSYVLNQDGTGFLNTAAEVIQFEFLTRNYFPITSLSNIDIMDVLNKKLTFLNMDCKDYINYRMRSYAENHPGHFLKEDGTVVDAAELAEILWKIVMPKGLSNLEEGEFLTWNDSKNIPQTAFIPYKILNLTLMQNHLNAKGNIGKTNMENMRLDIEKYKNIEQDRILQSLGEDASPLNEAYWILFMQEGGKIPEDGEALSEAIWHSFYPWQKKIVPMSVLKVYLDQDHFEFNIVKQSLQRRISIAQQTAPERILDRYREEFRDYAFLKNPYIPYAVLKKDILIADSKFAEAFWRLLSLEEQKFISLDQVREYLNRSGRLEEFKAELDKRLQERFQSKIWSCLQFFVGSMTNSQLSNFFEKDGAVLDNKSVIDKLNELVKYSFYSDSELKSGMGEILKNSDKLENLVTQLRDRKRVMDEQRDSILQSLEARISALDIKYIMLLVNNYDNRYYQFLEEKDDIVHLVLNSLSFLEKDLVPTYALEEYLDKDPSKLAVLKEQIKTRIMEAILDIPNKINKMIDMSTLSEFLKKNGALRGMSMISPFLEKNGDFIEDSKFAMTFWNTLDWNERKLISLDTVQEYLARPEKLERVKVALDNTLKNLCFRELDRNLRELDPLTLTNFFKPNGTLKDDTILIDIAFTAMEPSFLEKFPWCQSIIAKLFEEEPCNLEHVAVRLEDRKAYMDKQGVNIFQSTHPSHNPEEAKEEGSKNATLGKNQSPEGSF